MVTAGLARWAEPQDAPGVDLTGRLVPIPWVPVEAYSAEHRDAALEFGQRATALL